MSRFISGMAFAVMAILASVVTAQDPAPGWLGYATAQCPPGTKITRYEGKWKVGANPQPSFAFFSPWIGMDTSDNLNLLQPVNPWMGSSWSFYTEYYQWSPSNNEDSNSRNCNAGDQLHGSVVYNGDAAQTYTLTQVDVTQANKASSMTIPVQQDSNGDYKNYTILYVVYEKVADCNQYPPDGKVTFTDLIVECDGQAITPSWTTGFVEDVCNNRAHVVNSKTIEITWDTTGKNPTAAQKSRNFVKRDSMAKYGKKVQGKSKP